PAVPARPGRALGALLALAFVGLAAIRPAAALTQTISAAGTCADDPGTGTLAWTNPTNAQTSNDVYATRAFPNQNDVSHYLKCTNFGFTLPSTALIQGIQVEWEQSVSGGTITDSSVRIVKGGTIGTTEKATGTAWPTTDTFASY